MLVSHNRYAGMNVLLTLAGDESQAQPWPRVHAINTLRLAFSDKTLANDASGFFAQGMLPLRYQFSKLCAWSLAQTGGGGNGLSNPNGKVTKCQDHKYS